MPQGHDLNRLDKYGLVKGREAPLKQAPASKEPIPKLTTTVIPSCSKFLQEPVNEHIRRLDLGIDLFALLGKNPALAGFEIMNSVFLDFETTGLSGGAGTMIFLFGAAAFEKEGLVIKQYFLDSPGREREILREIKALLLDKRHLITFNGKSYDMQILNSRLNFNKMGALAPGDLKHFDLLHSARRILKQRLSSFSLQEIEREIFGEARPADIPSSEIPYAYFRYMRTRRTDEMELVIRHNREDILSMVYLLEKMTCIVSAKDGQGQEPCYYLPLAKLYDFAGREERALYYYTAALENDAPGHAEAVKRLCHLYKKRADHGKAEKLLFTYKKRTRGGDPYPYIELAKLYEHAFRDYGKALAEIEELTLKEEFLRTAGELETGGILLLENLQKRRSRLLRKLSFRGHD